MIVPANGLSIDGPLHGAVRTDECVWTLETGDRRFNSIVITLDKVKHTWWSYVVQVRIASATKMTLSCPHRAAGLLHMAFYFEGRVMKKSTPRR